MVWTDVVTEQSILVKEIPRMKLLPCFVHVK